MVHKRNIIIYSESTNNAIMANYVIRLCCANYVLRAETIDGHAVSLFSCQNEQEASRLLKNVVEELRAAEHDNYSLVNIDNIYKKMTTTTSERDTYHGMPLKKKDEE